MKKRWIKKATRRKKNILFVLRKFYVKVIAFFFCFSTFALACFGSFLFVYFLFFFNRVVIRTFLYGNNNSEKRYARERRGRGKERSITIKSS